MKHFNHTLARLLVVVVLMMGVTGAALLAAPEALASPVQQAQQGANDSGASAGPSLTDVIGTVTNILLFLIGAIAVIAIIIGGIQYVTAAGDESKTKTAKNTILYAVVGLVVAIAAYGIIDFVLNQF